MPAISETLDVFIKRVSLRIMNKDTMDVLLRRVRYGSDALDKTAEALVKDVSKIFPQLFTTQIESFQSAIVEETSEKLGTIFIC